MPMLKLIHGPGKYSDDEALHDVISYCTRLGKACCVDGIAVYPPNVIFEMERLAQAYGKGNGLRLRHWILSFSAKDLKGFKKANFLEMLQRWGWYAASYYGGQYQILFSVHMDSKNAHIHFVMSTINYQTGLKYPGDKGDYYAYQQYLRDFFCELGMTLIVAPDH